MSSPLERKLAQRGSVALLGLRERVDSANKAIMRNADDVDSKRIDSTFGRAGREDSSARPKRTRFEPLVTGKYA